MIIITGATGALGGGVVEHLLARTNPDGIAVAVRDPAKAASLAARGVEVRRADYAEPDTLEPAFADADQLLLVSSSDPAADAVALHRTAIDAAVRAGVGRILYTSHQGAAPHTPFGPGRDHAATESLLAATGTPWTSLRNGFYAHSLAWLAGPWRVTGRIVVPADGPVSWTAREDQAIGIAELLLDGAPDGPVVLTATDAPDFAEVAAVAADVAGRPVERVLVDPEEWVAGRIAAGMPDGMARFTLGMYEAAGGGFFAGTDPLLTALLGRAPRTVRDVLAG